MNNERTGLRLTQIIFQLYRDRKFYWWKKPYIVTGENH